MERLQRLPSILFHEFLEVLPPTLFCLVFFHIILFTTQLILSEFGIDLYDAVKVTVLALVIGKVVVVVDKMPFVRRLDGYPLLFPIIFKAVIFAFFVTLTRLAEPWLPAFVDTFSIAAANKHLSDHYAWRLFTAAQIWIFISFLIYFTASEVFKVFHFTRRQLLRAFFQEHPINMKPGA